jgi:hypothetical protein
MGKINPILNLSWAMALPAVNSKEAATADTMNARFVIGGVSKGKGERMLLGRMRNHVL